MIKYKELENIEEVIRVKHSIYSFPEIPYPFESVQNGVQRLEFARIGNKQHPVEGDSFKYIHLNSFGLYLYKEDIGLLNQQKDQEYRIISEQKSLNYYWILISLHQFLKSASQYFKRFGYWGTLLFQTELFNVLGINMRHPSSRLTESLILPRSNLKWERKFSAVLLQSQITDITTDVMTDVAWSLGANSMTDKLIKDYISINFQ